MTNPAKFPFLDKSDPGIWKALNGTALRAAEAAEQAGLARATVELLNVRVSQINGCAFCLDLHSRQARNAGASEQELVLLAAWRDTTVFDKKTRAALALAEVVTELPSTQIRHAVQSESLEVLGAEAFAAVEWLAIIMNAYNRFSTVSSHPVRQRPRQRDDEQRAATSAAIGKAT